MVTWPRKLRGDAKLNWFALFFRAPIDQTIGEEMAQIQLIVRKRST